MDLRNRFGGQAVIEGVMMRGAGRMALAVRRPDGSIHVTVRPHTAYAARRSWLGWPLLRGVAALAEALVVGIQVLNESAWLADEPAARDRSGAAGVAGAAADGAGGAATERGATVTGTGTPAPAGGTATQGDVPGDDRPRPDDRWATVVNVVALVLGLVFFILLPTWVATALATGELARNAVEGVTRLVLLLGYMAAIGRIPDIQRVYQYHGAEHKAIHALEAGAPLEPEVAQGFSRFHPRCGTAFLLFVAVTAVLVHALFGWPAFWQRTLLRLALVPVVAGVAYEWILLAGRSQRPWVRWMSAPGLWLQRLTTAEPSLDQLEVALAALKACLPQGWEQAAGGVVPAGSTPARKPVAVAPAGATAAPATPASR